MAGKRVLLISPLVAYTGNFFTVKRIRKELEHHGIECYLAAPADFEQGDVLQNYIHSNCISLVIGVHAYKSGKVLKELTIPYILILGGTDVNECCKDVSIMSLMTSSVLKASTVVAFSEAFAEKFKLMWPSFDINKILIIPQAVEVNPSCFCIKSFIKNNMTVVYNLPLEKSCASTCGNELSDDFVGVRWSSGFAHNDTILEFSRGSEIADIKLFTVAGGIRSVKNPVFLIQGFSAWRTRKERIHCYLLFIGPNLDDHYFGVFQDEILRCPGVIYMPPLVLTDTHAAINDSFALVNTSDSEGMSLAILEAMALRTPVMVRAIPGNKAIIQDGFNGVVFNTQEEFFERADFLLDNPEVIQKYTDNAYVYILEKHSVYVETESYVNLVKKQLLQII